MIQDNPPDIDALLIVGLNGAPCCNAAKEWYIALSADSAAAAFFLVWILPRLFPSSLSAPSLLRVPAPRVEANLQWTISDDRCHDAGYSYCYVYSRARAACGLSGNTRTRADKPQAQAGAKTSNRLSARAARHEHACPFVRTHKERGKRETETTKLLFLNMPTDRASSFCLPLWVEG